MIENNDDKDNVAEGLSVADKVNLIIFLVAAAVIATGSVYSRVTNGSWDFSAKATGEVSDSVNGVLNRALTGEDEVISESTGSGDWEIRPE